MLSVIWDSLGRCWGTHREKEGIYRLGPPGPTLWNTRSRRILRDTIAETEGRRTMQDGRISGRAPLAALLAAAMAVPAVADRGVPDPVPAPPGARSGTQSLLGRTALLWTSDSWQQLKAFWRRLDALEPGPGGYGAARSAASDSLPLWRIEAHAILEDVRTEAPALGIDSLELDMLLGLVERRMELLTWGSGIPMTRMMPPPVQDQLDDLAVRLEERIDALRALRDRGVLDGEEIRLAFDSLAADAASWVLLTAVRNGTGTTGVLYFQAWPLEADRILSTADSLTGEALRRIRQEGEAWEGQLEETAADLEALREGLRSTLDRLPALLDLLRDLELFGAPEGPDPAGA